MLGHNQFFTKMAAIGAVNNYTLMTPTQKAVLIIFMCIWFSRNHASSCQHPCLFSCSEIEGHLDKVQNLRKDRWIAEGKMRK